MAEGRTVRTHSVGDVEAPGPGGDVPDLSTRPEATVPPCVIGLGLRPEADPSEVDVLVQSTLAAAGLVSEAVALVATIDARVGHPALAGLPWQVVGYPAAVLAAVSVPNPSLPAAQALGTSSVAEAAALLAAGPGAELVVPKRRSDSVTIAVARTPSRPFDSEDQP